MYFSEAPIKLCPLLIALVVATNLSASALAEDPTDHSAHHSKPELSAPTDNTGMMNGMPGIN